MKSEDMELRLSMHRSLRVLGIIALLIVLVVETATAAYPTAADVNIQGSIWHWVPVKIVQAGGAGYSDYYPEYRLNADTGTFMMDTPFNSVSYIEKYFDLLSDGSSLSLTVWGVRNINGWCGDPVTVTVSLIDSNNKIHQLGSFIPVQLDKGVGQGETKKFGISNFAGQKVKIRIEQTSSGEHCTYGYFRDIDLQTSTITSSKATSLSTPIPIPIPPITTSAQNSDWRMFRHDPAHTGATEEIVPDELGLIWSYRTCGLRSSPTVVNGKVLVASIDGNIYCLDENTGKWIWTNSAFIDVEKYRAGYALWSSPAVSNGKVFFGSYTNKIYCLNENTGKLIWTYETGGSVLSSPAVVHGRLFVGSYDNKIYCLDENTGKLIWTYETGDGVFSSPAVANGKVFVASEDHSIYCLDENTGKLLWNHKTGDVVYSSPAVSEGKVFVGSRDNKIYCLDENNGNLIWSYATGGAVDSSPAISEGKVFVGSYDDKIYCLDADTGRLIWTHETTEHGFSSPTIADGKVFVYSDGKIYYLDENNGNLVWSYNIWGDGYPSPAVADGKLFVGSGSTTFCFGKVGSMTITSNPPGAEIYIDYHHKGTTPSTFEIPFGSHRVRLTKFGYSDYQTNIIVSEGETTKVHAPLSIASWVLLTIFFGIISSTILAMGISTKRRYALRKYEQKIKEYKAKVEQWEREGYKVSGFRERWFK